MKIVEGVLYALMFALMFGLVPISNIGGLYTISLVMSAISLLSTIRVDSLKRLHIAAMVVCGVNASVCIMHFVFTVVPGEWVAVAAGGPTLGLFLYCGFVQLMSSLRK